MKKVVRHPLRLSRAYVWTNTYDSFGDYSCYKKPYDKLQYRNEKGKWVDVPVYNETRKRYEKK